MSMQILITKITRRNRDGGHDAERVFVRDTAREISLQKTEIPRSRPVGMTGFAVTKHWQAGWRKSGVS